MRYIVLITAFFALGAALAPGRAEAANLTVSVLESDSFSLASISGATVTATHKDAGTLQTSTRPGSAAVFSDIAEGCWTLKVEASGYQPETKVVCIGKQDRRTSVSLAKAAYRPEIRFATFDSTAGGVTGGGHWSRVDINTRFNIGTVVNGGEHELLRNLDSIDRDGFDIEGFLNLVGDGRHHGPDGRGAIKLRVSHASGSAYGMATPATVGVGGITQIGQTYLYWQGATGVGSIFAGDYLTGSLSVGQDWTQTLLAYCETIAPNGPDGARWHGTLGLNYENLSQDFWGRTDIMRAGASLSTQQTWGETSDDYFGVYVGIGGELPLSEQIDIVWDSFLIPSLHIGKGSLRQTTSSSGINQALNFSNDGFALLGGIKSGIRINGDNGWSVDFWGEYSFIGNVSELITPATPLHQPAGSGSGTVGRWFAGARVTKHFEREFVPGQF